MESPFPSYNLILGGKTVASTCLHARHCQLLVLAEWLYVLVLWVPAVHTSLRYLGQQVSWEHLQGVEVQQELQSCSAVGQEEYCQHLYVVPVPLSVAACSRADLCSCKYAILGDLFHSAPCTTGCQTARYSVAAQHAVSVTVSDTAVNCQ
jgi:hypothetical protein